MIKKGDDVESAVPELDSLPLACPAQEEHAKQK